MLDEQTNPQARALDPDTVYLRDILLDVAKASGHPYVYVANDMSWRLVWMVWDSVCRRREQLADAARDNPYAAIALYMSGM